MSDDVNGNKEGSIPTMRTSKIMNWVKSTQGKVTLLIGLITLSTQFFEQTNILVKTAQGFWYEQFVELDEEYTEYILDASSEMRQPFSNDKIKWDSLNEALAEVLVSRENASYAVRIYGGKCNTDKATKKLKKFTDEISDGEIKVKIENVPPDGAPDLTRALDKAIDDLIGVRNLEKKFKALGLVKPPVTYKLKVIASGELCNKNPARLDEIKQRVKKDSIDLDFSFVALATNSDTYQDFESFAYSIAPNASVIPASNGDMLEIAITGNKEDIYATAFKYFNEEEEAHALGFFSLLGDEHVDGTFYRAQIRLNENGDFFDLNKAIELLEKVKDKSHEAAALLVEIKNVAAK